MTDPITRLNTALEGRYAIERELGEGGMATVYLADDLKHERKVALKGVHQRSGCPERGYARTGGLMTRATPFLVALLLTLPSGGSSQAAPSPGDRVRVRQLDGAVLTGTLATFSSEGIQLSIDSVSPPVEVPVSAIEALEASLSESGLRMH